MMDTLGPVSAALAADLQELTRQHGFVLWPDRAGVFTDFVDRLVRRRDAGQLAFDVVAYRGSFLDLMLELEPLVGGVAKRPLLIHLPGFDEAAARDTPLLELLCVGFCFRKPLTGVVTDAAVEKVPPGEIAELCAGDDLTLDEADAWLALRLAGQQAGELGRLHALRLPDVVDDLLRPRGVFTDLGKERSGPLWHYLSARSGVSPAWRDLCVPADHVRPEDLAFAVASWALCVEYVHDLKHREPTDPTLRAMDALPRPVIDACRELAVHLRARPDDFYRRTADETERRLEAEIREAKAQDLGDIDTFRFEEDKVLTAALEALAAKDWDSASRWAELRLRGPSFWLRVEPPRQLAWELVGDAARLGQAIAGAGDRLGDLGSLEEAVARYTSHGAAVDRAHRHLERRRGAISTTTPYYERLRERLDAARQLWSTWADAWARDFNALCRAHGFLPQPSLQQRTLFEDVVRPMAREPGITALFVVDALRFEMAEELFATFETGTATTAHLRARLAELPTVTEVGMNILAPVAAASGRLRPTIEGRKIKGFHTGEYTVHDPETRKRAMFARVEGTKCPWIPLDEIVARTPESLRRTIGGANLVVVHSREIDDLGEADTAFVSLAAFDVVLHRLRAAWALLREAGVRRFVITADHGFLLLNDPTRTPHGRKIDPRQRCVIDTVGADRSGAVRVALADLQYEDTGHHLFLPETTAVFDTAQRPSFVHGGNSLQERVVPVITLDHRAGAGGSQARYRVTVEPRERVIDMHRLKIRLEPDEQAALGFVGHSELELSLRVPEAPETVVDLRAAPGARLVGGAVVAPLGRDFELFFQLSGPTDARVLVEVYHPTAVADVLPCVAPDRYEVQVVHAAPREPEPPPPEAKPAAKPEPAKAAPAAPPPAAAPTRAWLEALPEGGIRRVFAHLADHGAISEVDIVAILDRTELRQFRLKYKEFVAKVPFGVHIDTNDNVKTYLREGTAP